MAKASEKKAGLGRLQIALRVALIYAALLGAIATLLFLSAGQLTWGGGWLYLALVASSVAASGAYVSIRNPALIAGRVQIGADTKTWDRVWLAVFAPVFLSVYVVAGLDAVRFGWSSMPGPFWIAGVSLFAPSTFLYAWAMGVNPFFEQTVRIQAEKGHRVIDSGPYRFVRHPGYVGQASWIFSIPLLLGSWWAFLPATFCAVAFIALTALEDRTLHNELPGYGDYARRVRFRLVPNVW